MLVSASSQILTGQTRRCSEFSASAASHWGLDLQADVKNVAVSLSYSGARRPWLPKEQEKRRWTFTLEDCTT